MNDEGNARVAEILDEYLQALEAGAAPDRDALLARHPDLAEALAAAFLSLDFVRGAAPSLTAGEDAVVGRSFGDYRLIREVGRGGMGVVYEAEQVSLQRRVALKVLPFAAVFDPKQLQRFKNEALAAAHLRHPNIVPVYGVGCERGIHYYAMQYVEGQSLAVAIRDMSGEGARDGPSTPISSHGSHREPAYVRMAALLGVQAAEALDHAHELGIVHRDVKPANLLVDQGGHLWVTDFGLARPRRDLGLTRTGELLGTVRYMSPEQAMGKRTPVDHRTDVYSLGATLYELLTLRPAFPGEDPHGVIHDILSCEPVAPRKLNPSIPADLETVLRKAMSKDPSGRYATAQEMAEDLERHLEHRPILARRPSLGVRSAKWARRHRGLVTATSVALLLGVAALAVDAYRVGVALDRAQSNLRLARNAVDKYLIEAGAGEIQERPLPPPGRRALLEDALKFYEEHLADREDPSLFDKRVTILHALHRYGDALEMFDRILDRDPGDARALIWRGHLRWHLGRSDEALADLDRSIGIREGSADAHFFRGLVLLSLDRPAEAARAHERALAIAPRMEIAHLGLGDALFTLEEFEKAAAAYRRATELAPHMASAHAGLGNAHHALGRFRDALAAHERALDLDPYFALAHTNRGHSLQSLGRLDDAEAAHRKALELAPDLAEAHEGLGLVLAARSQSDDAIREFRAAVGLRPRNVARAHFQLGRALAEGGETREAISEYRKSIEHKPLPETYLNLGNAFATLGDVESAIAAYRSVLAARPDHAELRTTVGDLLATRGRYEEAIVEYVASNRIRPHADTLTRLGHAYLGTGDLKREIEAYREALRLREDHPQAWAELGFALQRAGEPEESIRASRRALAIKSDFPEAHLNLGNALVLAGHPPEEAIAEFREAIRLGSDAARGATEASPPGTVQHYTGIVSLAYNSLGVASSRIGRRADAMKAFQEALARDPELPEALCSLGREMMKQGRYRDALPLLEKGNRLGSQRPAWGPEFRRWLEQAQRRAKTEEELDRVLAGGARPGDPLEWTAYAMLLYEQGRYAEAMRMWTETFAEASSLAEDVAHHHRYNAACAAVLAAAEGGADAPAWRGQALDWLSADLGARQKAGLLDTLARWKEDADLASVRDRLHEIPAGERGEWAKLWATVDATLARAPAAR